MMQTTKPVESLLHIINACKEAYNNLTKANVYIVDLAL